MPYSWQDWPIILIAEICPQPRTRLRPQQLETDHLAVPYPCSRFASNLSKLLQSLLELAV